jgi:hypothetical protein
MYNNDIVTVVSYGSYKILLQLSLSIIFLTAIIKKVNAHWINAYKQNIEWEMYTET